MKRSFIALRVAAIAASLAGSVHAQLGQHDPACPTLPNACGFAATMELRGTGNAGEDLFATATQGCPNKHGYFLVSYAPGSYFVPPGSQGVLCLAPPTFRYNSFALSQVFRFDAAGVSQAQCCNGPSILPTNGSFGAVPPFLTGDSVVFQGWYRDPGSTNNFTDSVILTFT